MRIRTILLLGCMVNVALIFGIMIQGGRGRPAVVVEEKAPVVVETNTGPVPVPVVVQAVEPAATAPTNRPLLQWADLESDDYLQLATNLLSAGCPSRTVRDIVLARAQDDYSELLWDLQKSQQPQYWSILAKTKSPRDFSFSDDLEKRINEISSERDEVIGELGKALPAMVEQARLSTPDAWGHLPPDIRAQVLAIQQEETLVSTQVDETLAEIEDVRERRKQKQEVMRKFREVQNQRIRALVGDVQMDEQILRNSDHARWIRSVVGVELSPEEMRQLASARNQVDADIEIPSRRDKAAAEVREERLTERQALRSAAVVKVIGPERFQEVERAEDGEYQTMRKVAWRHGLPMEVANRGYAIKQVAINQANELVAVPGLDDERRAKAAAALLLNVRQELSGVYGLEAFPSLEKYGMDWLDDLFSDVDGIAEPAVSGR